MFHKKSDMLFKVKDLTKGISLDLENDLAILNAFSLKYSTEFVENLYSITKLHVSEYFLLTRI